MKEPEYKVRPSAGKDVFRIFLSPSQLLLHKLHAGDVCHLVTLDQSSTRPAVVWPATEKIRDDVVQTSRALQSLYGLKLDSRISIRRGEEAIMDAGEITLCEIPPDEPASALPNLDHEERSGWAWLLKHYLRKAEILSPGMVFDSVEACEERRSFRIQSINSSVDPILYRARPSCKICLQDGDSESPNNSGFGKSLLVVPSERVGGLDKQIKLLNRHLVEYGDLDYERDITAPIFYRGCQGGVLLHGAAGTGKTTILRMISEASWRKVFHINKTTVGSHQLSENESIIHTIFSEALDCQPSVIIIDDLESIAGKQTSMNPAPFANIGQILCHELDRIFGTRTLAVGATRSLTGIDPDLRQVRRLQNRILIPIPPPESRAGILKALCGIPTDEIHWTVERIAKRTHGFVAADLENLLLHAVKDAKVQDSETGSARPLTEVRTLLRSMEDAFDSALRVVRPSVLQGITLEIPETKWSDIGGQQEVKDRLEQAVVWPVKVKLYLHHGVLPVPVANIFTVL